MNNTSKSLIAIIIMISSIVTIVYFLIYPKQTDIKIFLNSWNLSNITKNTTIKILTSISKPQPSTQVLGSQKSDLIIEEITQKKLKQYKNSGNTLVYVEPYNTQLEIKKVNIKGKIFDGTDSKTLSNGLWHFPLSTGPGTEGNFIVIAHRYDKMPPNQDTFFNLDKVDIGDEILITQDKNEWTYIVTESKIVESNDRSVLMQTQDHRITLITCAPLWSSEKRLIVIGKLNRVNETL